MASLWYKESFPIKKTYFYFPSRVRQPLKEHPLFRIFDVFTEAREDVFKRNDVIEHFWRIRVINLNGMLVSNVFVPRFFSKDARSVQYFSNRGKQRNHQSFSITKKCSINLYFCMYIENLSGFLVLFTESKTDKDKARYLSLYWTQSHLVTSWP